MSSTKSHISLIDLSKQFPFEIDDVMKKAICFDETLTISCGHCEDDEEFSDSDWTCTDSSASEVEEDGDKTVFEIKEKSKEETRHDVEEDRHQGEDDDFQFYFFSDCKKPIAQDSKASIVIVNGMPQINFAVKRQAECTCATDKNGLCPCHIKLPCHCGAKTVDQCKCLTVENICVCGENKTPQLVCTCKPNNVCVCYPDCGVRPICTCAQIDKPCICKRDKFPCPVCICECKPKLDSGCKISITERNKSVSGEDGTEEGSEESMTTATKASEESEKEPCTCQVPIPKPICLCLSGKECVCKIQCICDIRPPCICEPDEDHTKTVCQDDSSKTICECPKPQQCKCDAKSPSDCQCFPKPIVCSCGNPDDCKCYGVCSCADPCICGTASKEDLVCTRLENKQQIAGGKICTCPPPPANLRKLKKARAGKRGYRWCHDVDPRHTYFDYAYDRHDKISYKKQEQEKMKILGLYDEPKAEQTCELHQIKGPEYKKKTRKPTLDCCSAVGGINISVETLGEDKNKFLVQIVSHSSKEGAKCGTKLVAILDCNLHTLEENRTEHITKKNLTKERRSYMTICESGYYNKVTRICGERNFVKRIYHSFEDAHNFLLEGANVLLLRYFSINRYKGNIKTDTVLIDGTVCESIYVCLGVSQAIVNGKALFVVKVERHIIEPSGYILQTLTVMTLKGYIVSHEWADNSYIFHINPLLRVVPEKDEIERHEPLREKWRDDLQLLSDYLDFKSTRSSEGARYVTENGELTGTIRDYLQTLLLLRPHDALHFTRHYFGSALSALDLPHNEFFDPCVKHVRYFFFEE